MGQEVQFGGFAIHQAQPGFLIHLGEISNLPLSVQVITTFTRYKYEEREETLRRSYWVGFFFFLFCVFHRLLRSSSDEYLNLTQLFAGNDESSREGLDYGYRVQTSPAIPSERRSDAALLSPPIDWSSITVPFPSKVNFFFFMLQSLEFFFFFPETQWLIYGVTLQ